MKNFWKKTGWTCLTILPGIVSLVTQILMGVVLVIILGIIVAMTPELMADAAAAEQFYMDGATKYNGILIFAYHLISIPAFGLWYYLGCGRPKATNPLPYFKEKALPVTILLSISLCFFANAFVLVGQYVAPAAIESYMELMEAAGLGVDAFAIFASIFLAPIGEEIVCRGITYHYAKKIVADMNNRRVAFWIANALQAVMFGVMHANLIQGLYAFLLGLGLGWLRERYNSLYPAMLAHAIINFSSTYVVGYPISLLPENIVSYLILMVASIAVIGAAIYMGKESENKDGNSQTVAS
ncbi:MAG: CPBP family intramembrane metalloprotease [Lachnospiraceae bacterium]|nr:CPBP family intramembrane metalloprotease [Lachnospiraceae bacterium]